MTQRKPPGTLTHLRSGGVSVVLDSRDLRLPCVHFWGPDLGIVSDDDLVALADAALPPVRDSEIDVVSKVSLVPTAAEGWTGVPGLRGSRAGADFSAAFEIVGEVGLGPTEIRATGRRYHALDIHARLALTLQVELTHGGLVRLQSIVTNNDPDDSYDLEGLVMALPVPSEAEELLDFTGRHALERIPQRGPFQVGTHLRESRKGKPGLDASYILAAGRCGFGFVAGQVWGVHVGWSGNQSAYAEKTFHGHRLLGGGELLLSGEIALGPGESYTSPWLFGAYGNGLNELAGRFHSYLRSRPTHPRTPRPVVVNTWEAVYYDQDLDGLLALAEAAAAVGAERFVLDDGWFHGRRSDKAGLGDWYVDAAVWPDGLAPLISKVNGLGMEFGLWVEPEMINLDSDLARAHPDWIFQAGGRTGLPSRYQHVLDLGHPEAYAYVADRLLDLLDSYQVAYLKWDHNRMVTEAGHTPNGTPGVHVQTLAVYRLMDELRQRHPGLEIENCAGGGGRIDLGILEHTDRVWPSDCIDALDRQQINRYTQLLVPPELIGTHVGAPMAHTTRRVLSLPFRAAAALWGHMGIEWNLAAATSAERIELARWVTLHKELRGLLHRGTVVVGDHPDPAVWVNGVVSLDRSEAVYGITTVARSVTWPPGRVRLPGLDPDERYLVQALPPGDRYPEESMVPPWWTPGITLSGRVLAEVGLQIPAMFPEYTHLLRAIASSD